MIKFKTLTLTLKIDPKEDLLPIEVSMIKRNIEFYLDKQIHYECYGFSSVRDYCIEIDTVE